MKEIIYPTVNQFIDLKKTLSQQESIPTDPYICQLRETISPKQQNLLKEICTRQASWRVQEQQKIVDKLSNPDNLDVNILEKASQVWTGLKERKCSYGDYVFNFAFPKNKNYYPDSIKIPSDLPQIIWGFTNSIDESNISNGIPMARIDAIRQKDNSIRIIEINPCWIDNIGALQSFNEVYNIQNSSNEKTPTKLITENLSKLNTKNKKIALLYCRSSNGCKKDEMFGFANYLSSTSFFDNIQISSIRDVALNENNSLTVKGVDVSMVYLNGSFSMANEEEISSINKIKIAQKNGLILSPIQLDSFDQKDTLIDISQKRPDLFVKTTNSPPKNVEFIAKPIRSESLKGVQIFKENNFPDLENFKNYVFQPTTYSETKDIVCIDTKTKIITCPEKLFEKLNIWIIGNEIAGILATYSTNPMINDSGYNLPIKWESL